MEEQKTLEPKQNLVALLDDVCVWYKSPSIVYPNEWWLYCHVNCDGQSHSEQCRRYVPRRYIKQQEAEK